MARLNWKHSTENPGTIQKIQAWLDPTDFACDSSDFRKYLNAYMPATGNWLQSDQFARWHSSGGSILWINGIPGSGKSVYAATLIEKFQQEPVPVLFFFFRHAKLSNKTPRQMIRDRLSQLLENSPMLQSVLKRMMDAYLRLDDVPFDDFWGCFRSAATATPRMYCVADALDEMGGGTDEFLHQPLDLGKSETSIIKVLATSRKSPHIVAILGSPCVAISL